MEKSVICTSNRINFVTGIILCGFGIIFSVSLYPSLVQHHLSKIITLNEGSHMRRYWSKFPFPYEFHCYLFNVTNPDEILAGAKPILTEIGPFVYDVWQEKVNIQDHEEDDSVSYTLKKTYLFNASKSNGLSEEDEFTLVHFLYVGMANAILRTQPTTLPLVSRSIDSIFNKPKSIFVKVTAKKYLFDGYEIDCVGVEEFFAKVVCNNLKENSFQYRIQMVKQDFYTTSIWGTFNDTIAWSGRTRINRGIKNIKEIGKIIEYNNSSDFGKWNDEKCDTFLGTDGFMYRPMINQHDHLYKVDTVVARSFDYQYDSKVVYNKLSLFRYKATVGTDLKTNPDHKCYCITPDSCLKNGVFELWKSMNWALVASNPHFYLADPYYNDAVVGLNPDKEKHMSTFDVHPFTGVVLRANFREQMNAPLTRLPKYRLFKNICEAQLPIGWFEEKFILPDSYIEELNHLQFMLDIEKFFGYVMIGAGLLLCTISVVRFIMERKKTNLFLHTT